ncbi:restriction endonuclease [Actinopolymorpha sp. NPDC004070]|uniref:restriction endonuclease n=1 Tax=Actinopolymorpha sp. NPDC004070 TaxID=3154548 RepID=UPI0033B91B47
MPRQRPQFRRPGNWRTRRAASARERLRAELDEQRMREDAAVRTEGVEQRVQKLGFVLRATMPRTVAPLDFEAQKERVPFLDLGPDAVPAQVPTWADFAPRTGRLRRLLTRDAHRQAAQAAAEQEYTSALERYREEEAARLARIEERGRAHHEASGPDRRRVLAHNAGIDRFRDRVLTGDPEAVCDYFTRIFAPFASRPAGFPRGHRFGYVPESRLLVVEWRLPGVDVVPREREYRYNPATKSVGVHRWRPISEVRKVYEGVCAQLAIRAVHVALSADPADLVQTVVFNGVVTPGSGHSPEHSPEHGHDHRPGHAADGPADPEEPVCLISLSTSRRQFARLPLDDLDDPLGEIRSRFGARVSAFPDELSAVSPVLPYELADPHLFVASSKGPNLLATTPEEFGRLMERLLERMGYQLTPLPQGSGSYLARRTTGGRTEQTVVQVQRRGGTMETAEVRALGSAVRRRHATEGLLLTTSGLEPQAYDYAHGRPLRLYAGRSLLALCRIHGLPARMDPPAATAVAATADGPTGSQAANGRAHPAAGSNGAGPGPSHHPTRRTGPRATGDTHPAPKPSPRPPS